MKTDPVYVLAGEPLLVQRKVQELIDATVPPASRAFNLDQLDARAAGAIAIANAARTLPMMGKQRAVVVRDADQLGAGLAELVPYLENPSPETVLILLVGKIDGRIKFYQTAKKRGYLHDLEAPRQAAPWIRDEVRRRGAAMTDDGVRRLAEVAAGDLGRLASAVEQLSLYAGDRPITSADVDDLIAETRERTVFELANAVGEAQHERALRAVDKLFEQRESAVGVAMMLARHMRQIALIKEAAQQRQPDLARAAGVPPFVVDGLLAQARRFNPAALTRAFALLAQADRDLKGPVKGALGERILVERLVGDLIGLSSR